MSNRNNKTLIEIVSLKIIFFSLYKSISLITDKVDSIPRHPEYEQIHLQTGKHILLNETESIKLIKLYRSF